MEVQYIDIQKLKPYDKNPRINGAAIEYVKKSIKANGFNQPLVVDQDLTICVGHTRMLAAKELGLETIPCYVKEMTKAQFIAYNLADNKTSEYSHWDKGLLAENFAELQLIDDELLEGTGFDQSYIDNLMESLTDGEEESEEASTPNKEIDTSNYGSELDQECPKCGFQFEGKKK